MHRNSQMTGADFFRLHQIEDVQFFNRRKRDQGGRRHAGRSAFIRKRSEPDPDCPFADFANGYFRGVKPEVEGSGQGSERLNCDEGKHQRDGERPLSAALRVQIALT